MPLKINLKVGDDTMDVEADAMDEQIVKLAETWVTALPPASQTDAATAAKVRELRDSVKGSRETLGAAVDAAAPVASAPRQ